MLKFIKYIFGSLIGGVIGGFLGVFFFIILISGLVQLLAMKSDLRVGSNAIEKDRVLILDLSNPMGELGRENFIGETEQYSIHDVQEALDEAARDKDVKALLIIGSARAPMGWATAKDLKRIIKDFSDSGKTSLAYADMMDEKSLYVTSHVNQIYMHPTGEVYWNGLASTPSFYKGTLEKLEVKPMIFRAGKFKSAIEMFTQAGMSPESRQQTAELLEDVWEEAVEEVAAGRKLDVKDLQDYANDYSVQTAAQAKEVGLISGVTRYTNVVEKLLKKNDGEELKKKDLKRLVGIKTYLASKKEKIFSPSGPSVFSKKIRRENKIAVLVLEGNIMTGDSGEDVIGSDTVVRQLQKLRLDEKVKGVILRVNSPGGSALASDVIWYEVERLKKKKPVYASMADVAASGGYYISAGANKIFAEANTITGSIGVFSILFNLKETFKNKVGMTFDSVSTSPFADLGSAVRDMSEAEKEVFQKSVLRIYKNFMKVVEKGRKYSNLSDVEIVAQGRVWSGNQAKEVGLVDELGGVEDAGLLMAEELKLEEYELDYYPKQRPFDRFFASLGGVSSLLKEVRSYVLKPTKALERDLKSLSHEGPLLWVPIDFNIN